MAAYGRGAIYQHIALSGPAVHLSDVLNVGNSDTFTLQWIQHVAAGSVSDITLYGSCWPDVREVTAAADPATSPLWFPVQGEAPGFPAAFATLPQAAIGTDYIVVCVDFLWLRVRMDVAVSLTDFSLYSHTKKVQ